MSVLFLTQVLSRLYFERVSETGRGEMMESLKSLGRVVIVLTLQAGKQVPGR